MRLLRSSRWFKVLGVRRNGRSAGYLHLLVRGEVTLITLHNRLDEFKFMSCKEITSASANAVLKGYIARGTFLGGNP